MFEVKVKPGHPTGKYHRAGMEFTATPRRMDMVPEAVRADPWLVVSEVKDQVEVKDEVKVKGKDKAKAKAE